MNVNQKRFLISLDYEETMTTDNDAERIEDGNDVRLTFRWDSPQSLLEKPPLTAGSVKKLKGQDSLRSLVSVGSGMAELNAVIIPGDRKLPCFKMYDELETLKGFATGLCGKGIYIIVNYPT